MANFRGRTFLEFMVKLNIAHIGSNDWFNFKADIVYGLYHSLTALGHEVSMSHNQFFTGVHNVVIGADWLVDEAHLQHIRQTEAEFSIYDVECFDGKTINQRAGFKIDNYLELLNMSRFICTPYRYNFQAYEACGLTDKAHYARWGFFHELVSPNINRRAAIQHDAVFFGLAKGERQVKLNKLVEVPGMRLRTVDNKSPHMSRDYYLSSTRYGLSLSAGAGEQFVNPFRIYLMSANGVPVLADNPRDEDGYLDFTARGSLEDICEFFADPQSRFELTGSLADGVRLADELRPLF
ncbi:hypothetical protein [Pseudomonas eucalypticola]|uniref:Glycosyltransferase family 1 protein n=1 Tax=Pseudomonas eucalypticola TaxID=2599595 RepID=A0A7D5HES7_9PSED|nr:hypothetical protein [Pseudomonas eucalypticola]QKZ03606.1 hypothetical protein HWQ56_07315 [Pseudomonas eucalypticola]